MSFQITTAFVQQYSSSVQHLVQQRGSRLRGAVTVEPNVVGKNAYFDQIGSVEAQKVTNRHGDSPLISTPHKRRRVSLVDYDWGDLVDTLDRVRLLIDPTSPYTQNAAWAMGRAMDDEIIGAAFASADTGEDGTTAVTLPAGNVIAVNYVESGGAANSDMTIGKLRRAKQLLDENETDPQEDRFIALQAKQLNSLLQTTEVTSSDYNTVRALVQGELNQFVGFEFIRTERLLATSDPYTRVICWVRSGIGLAIGKDITARISERADKRYSTYVYYMMSLGSTRIEEEKVLEILCDES